MDSATNIKSWGELVNRGIATPNEARAEFALKPVAGGDSPYLQQQNYSLAALDKRDSKADPFATAKPAAPPRQNRQCATPQAPPPPKSLPFLAIA